MVRTESSVLKKFSEGALRGLSIQSYKSADEAWKPAIDLERAERGFVNSSLKKNTFELLQVGRGQLVRSFSP